MWFRRRKSDENLGIEAGQRFRSVGAASLVWEVDAIARYDWENEPHARLSRVGTSGDARTIALRVLCDGRFYQPVT